jgi:hypothetical protein
MSTPNNMVPECWVGGGMHLLDGWISTREVVLISAVMLGDA